MEEENDENFKFSIRELEESRKGLCQSTEDFNVVLKVENVDVSCNKGYEEI